MQGGGFTYAEALPVLDELRQATQARHQALEAISPLLRPTLDRATYTAVLLQYWGLYGACEQALEPYHDALRALGIDPLARRKQAFIERDLAALGVAPTVWLHTQAVEAPPLRSLAAALGCLYVLEGATLGGQVICRKIAPQLGLTADCGVGFFSVYGREVGKMWREFLQALQRGPQHSDDVRQAADAACAVFAAFHARTLLAARQAP